MKRCQDIQAELSAYVDGELSSALRAEIETHLASCPRCQQELSELRTLAVGMAALPKLQPPPRFLANVRRKIARGDRPEPMTWQDYLFRPFWLKVPLEMAALIAVVVLVMRFEQQPVPVMVAENGAPVEMAKAENAESARNETSLEQKLVAGEAQISALPANKPEPAPAERPAMAAPAAPGIDTIAPKERQAQLAQHFYAQLDKDRAAGSAEAAAPSGAVGGKPSVFGAQARSDITARRTFGLASDSSRRIPTTQSSSGQFSLAPPPGPDVAALARDLGIEPSKLGEMVVVDARNPSDVRAQAEELAERCHGNVIWAPDLQGSTGDVFFVEVPQEYAATFKLELLRSSELSATLADTKNRAESGVSSGAVAASTIGTGVVSGVLIGGRSTNVTAGRYTTLTLADNASTQETATVVLEIRVVTPKH